jgi:hypothetical protein
MNAKTWKLSLLAGAALALGTMPCYADSAAHGSKHTAPAQETAPDVAAGNTTDVSATAMEDTGVPAQTDAVTADTDEDAAKPTKAPRAATTQTLRRPPWARETPARAVPA